MIIVSKRVAVEVFWLNFTLVDFYTLLDVLRYIRTTNVTLVCCCRYGVENEASQTAKEANSLCENRFLSLIAMFRCIFCCWHRKKPVCLKSVKTYNSENTNARWVCLNRSKVIFIIGLFLFLQSQIAVSWGKDRFSTNCITYLWITTLLQVTGWRS